MDTVLGHNMKRIRKELSLSLSNLAEEIGVTASFLSQVETGKMDPSLARLKQIADSLNVTISELVGETSKEQRKIVVRKGETTVMPGLNEGVCIELLSSKNKDNFMQPYQMTFQAKAHTGDYNSHFGQECGFVLEGEIELWVGEERFRLGKGDNFYYNAGIPHRFINVNNDITVVYIVAHPPVL